ncbi:MULTISPECIES: anthranilate synthase component II [Heyndrickxia]|uniref:Aminodeoxychorismate/anthranilate synthase component II n=1 Tax=Heyndrickxia faecalis TaxID=2824910 RepID=A0AAU7WKP5_9BACI|nr:MULTISPECIES: aminodeoxychorismate/anthranilate synthase component II [Heyndrickxia]APB37079.1 aminodeoxychorismate/anthranilate synthase component II [Heyndrickxia coagulans]AVD57107.1 type 1 glutamine amidotransferase [Heyndrickxia coagulans]AWP38045.1 type 1 glutamine amidotransferase [Heyndrickxia coagulans]MED4922256.1 aminodeoxychorismate/anthranilate synthase component II [Weizmannia sp. CD-2023]MED4978037.1 aminodeoxychorismate/anthranilate synthase component II [Weizmannia sp. CD-2
MILLLDNYDSFTYNLYQYFCELGEEVKVFRNDRITVDEIRRLKPEAIVLSPGPGVPENAGISIETVKTFYRQIPLLGVCLGHQAIAAAFGAGITKAKEIKHGKTSLVRHDGKGIFSGLPDPVEVMRYHSLVMDRTKIPEVLEVVAESLDDGEIMAIQHQSAPCFGVQFHPESIGTETGKQMLENFLREIRKDEKVETVS